MAQYTGARYVVLNPLRAKIVQSLEEWQWSSHQYVIGDHEAPEWLDAEWLLGQFGSTRREAVAAYQRFVMDGPGLDSPLKKVSHQLILGDAAFVLRHRSLAGDDTLHNVSKAHRRAAALTLAEYERQFPDRDLAIASAYFSMVFTMAQIAEFFGISERTVHRAIRKVEGGS